MLSEQMFDKMVKAIGFSPGITVFEQNLELESQSKGRDVSKKAGKAQMDEKKEKKRPRCCGGVFSGNKGINQDTVGLPTFPLLETCCPN